MKFPLCRPWNRAPGLESLGLAVILAGSFLAYGCQGTDDGPQLRVRYARRGTPFATLGPNPGAISAQAGHTWHAMDVALENECPDPVQVKPQDFRLYLSLRPRTEDAESFTPSTTGMQFQVGRLRADRLQPGQSIGGRLLFQVPHTLKNGQDSDAAYHILRYPDQPSCSVTHAPY